MRPFLLLLVWTMLAACTALLEVPAVPPTAPVPVPWQEWRASGAP